MTGGIVILFNSWTRESFKKLNWNYLLLESLKDRRFKMELKVKEIEAEEKQLISNANFETICIKLKDALKQKAVRRVR